MPQENLPTAIKFKSALGAQLQLAIFFFFFKNLTLSPNSGMGTN
jgi:hypothetical protein